MNLLQTHCGIGKSASKKLCKRGRKIVPGKRICFLPSTSSNSAATSEESGADVHWVCNTCKVLWEAKGDNRWIVCDVCSKQYHLQCSGVSTKPKTITHLTLRDTFLSVTIVKTGFEY